METGFEKIVAKDGEIFKIGNITLEAIHTPGHTMESTCYLLRDEAGKEVAIFTGDTLFIGDVGRPDLAQKVIADLTQDKLARHLYNSLRTKIMPLDDNIIVYPAHGAGSACGKNMSKETFDKLGNQKKNNYALQPMTEDEFVVKVLDGLMPPPSYFPQNVMINIKGYESLDDVMKKGTRALSVEEFETVANETNAIILDTRSKEAFTKSYIPRSIFIGIDGSFATWVGTLITDIKQEILIVAEEGRVEEVITRLARVGYDNAIGYLKGGFEAWEKAGKETDHIESIQADALAALNDAEIVDIRKKSEYNSEHVANALNAPLDYVNESMKLILGDHKKYVHCASGYRSLIFISILQARGYRNLVDVAGGFTAMKATGKYNLTEYVCPTTML